MKMVKPRLSNRPDFIIGVLRNGILITKSCTLIVYPFFINVYFLPFPDTTRDLNLAGGMIELGSAICETFAKHSGLVPTFCFWV